MNKITFNNIIELIFVITLSSITLYEFYTTKSLTTCLPMWGGYAIFKYLTT